MNSQKAWHGGGQGFESPQLHAFSIACSTRGAKRGATHQADLASSLAVDGSFVAALRLLNTVFMVSAPLVITGLSW